MSKKSAMIAALIASCQGRELDAHYLGYFECFNRGLFYEAHDVLEELWLPNRNGAIRTIQHTFQQTALGVPRPIRKLWHAKSNLLPNPISENRIR